MIVLVKHGEVKIAVDEEKELDSKKFRQLSKNSS